LDCIWAIAIALNIVYHSGEFSLKMDNVIFLFNLFLCFLNVSGIHTYYGFEHKVSKISTGAASASDKVLSGKDPGDKTLLSVTRVAV
jgi:hypothetical protein